MAWSFRFEEQTAADFAGMKFAKHRQPLARDKKRDLFRMMTEEWPFLFHWLAVWPGKNIVEV